VTATSAPPLSLNEIPLAQPKPVQLAQYFGLRAFPGRHGAPSYMRLLYAAEDSRDVPALGFIQSRARAEFRCQSQEGSCSPGDDKQASPPLSRRAAVLSATAAGLPVALLSTCLEPRKGSQDRPSLPRKGNQDRPSRASDGKTRNLSLDELTVRLNTLGAYRHPPH